MADSSQVMATSVSKDSTSHVIIAIVSFFLPLVAFMVGLRFYTRTRLVRSVGIDDWVILLALCFTIATGVTEAAMTASGLGHHVATLTSDTIERYMFDFYLTIVFYYVSLGLIKLGLLLQYYPLVAVKSRRLMTIITASVSVWSLILVFLSIFNCRPIDGFWKTNVDAVCVPNLPLWYINAAGNIITDIIIFALPIPIVWKLQMPSSQRISLLLVFCLGFFTCSISIVRMTYLNLGPDFTYANIAPASWSLGELCAGISCACLPTLRPLLFRVVNPNRRRKRATEPAGFKLVHGSGDGSALGRVSRSATLSRNKTLLSTTVQDVEDQASSLDEERSVKSRDTIEQPAQVFRNVM